MSKKYTQLNNLVTQSRENLHKAYDRGYAQAKEDYKRPMTEWIPEAYEGGVQFRCKQCKRMSIAAYLYCPHCGCINGDKDVKQENSDAQS